MGDWRELLKIDERTLPQHPQRDRLALLLACAHQQQGDGTAAERLTRHALSWGCDAKLVARLLISGVHNSLGRASALRDDEAGVSHHFREALAVTGDSDGGAASHTRVVRELAGLGLLPQAARLLKAEVEKLDVESGGAARTAALIDTLKTEIDLLQHELSIAQQRGQVGAQHAGAAASDWRQRATSQLGQELWVLEKTGFKRGGFFVEFGATDGVLLSNTWLLEKEFGWRGICAEPNPEMFERLRRNRGCTVSDACIAGESGREVDFILAGAYGTMEPYANADMHSAKRKSYVAAGNVKRVTTVTLNDLLIELGAPRTIDYLSVDTEGSELEILQAFPFSEWDVRLITVEHNYTAAREAIAVLLAAQGFERTPRQWDDWYEKHSEQTSHHQDV